MFLMEEVDVRPSCEVNGKGKQGGSSTGDQNGGSTGDSTGGTIWPQIPTSVNPSRVYGHFRHFATRYGTRACGDVDELLGHTRHSRLVLDTR
jgi:hypothetical protein